MSPGAIEGLIVQLHEPFMRLDQALLQRGLFESREQAKRAILAGQIRVNDQRARKASDAVRENDAISVQERDRYVSRGGHKLEHALKVFQLNLSGAQAADLGASTGGFTDCLLQHGAARVAAVDVGKGQLAWKLRQDPRVVVLEGTNARYITLRQLPDFDALDVVVVDCSFISLEKILPAAAALLRHGGRLVALVKPQFEAGKREVDRGSGVIRDPRIHDRVLSALRGFVSEQPELRWIAETESPLLGPAGNKEFLIDLEKT